MTIQCDEMWSFVSNKGNKQWIWLALDMKTGEQTNVNVQIHAKTQVTTRLDYHELIEEKKEYS